MKYLETAYKKFIETRDKMPANRKPFLTPYTVEEYTQKGATCYLAKDEKSGYAILENSDLVSVFSFPGAKAGRDVIMDAVERGARTLDCVDGFLAKNYETFGFVEYKREPWNNEYAHRNWDYKAFGTPDIVYMKKK